MCCGFACQHFGVLLGIYPHKHAGQWLLVHFQAHAFHHLQAAVAGFIQTLTQAQHVFAVLAVGQNAVHHALAQLGAGQAAEQFGIGQRANAFGLGRDIAHAQAASQCFGETSQQDDAAQPVQCGQPHGVLRGKVSVGVVFQHQKVMLFGQAQHVIGYGQRQSKARRVVHHRVGDQHFGLVGGGQMFQYCQIGPIAQAWNRQHLHPQGAQHAKYHEPGRVLYQDRIAGAQSAAQHQIHALGNAGDSHQLLLGVNRQPLGQQVGRQLLAQRRVTLRCAIAQQLHACAAPHTAHGGVEHVVVHPVGGQDAGAAIQLRTFCGAEHAAQQKGCIKRRIGREDGRFE